MLTLRFLKVVYVKMIFAYLKLCPATFIVKKYI